jgi:hypothetical protein
LESDEERMARLWRIPLELVDLYARVTRSFVEAVAERWARPLRAPAL